MQTFRFPDLWRFLLISATALLSIAVTTSLGFWQLDRAAQKKAVFDAITRQKNLPPWRNMELAEQVPMSAQALSDERKENLLHRPVKLQGRWLPEQTVFLDNRQMQGKAGFYVLTPLRLEAPNDGVVVIVQRGWAPRNFMDRQMLPEVLTSDESVVVEGALEVPPSRLMDLAPRLEGADPDGEKSRIRQNVDIGRWAQQSGLPLLSLSVVQHGVSGEGLQRDWPQIQMGVQKHYGYAFQWFGLSVLMMLLYVWFQIVRRFYPSRSTISGAMQSH